MTTLIGFTKEGRLPIPKIRQTPLIMKFERREINYVHVGLFRELIQVFGDVFRFLLRDCVPYRTQERHKNRGRQNYPGKERKERKRYSPCAVAGKSCDFMTAASPIAHTSSFGLPVSFMITFSLSSVNKLFGGNEHQDPLPSARQDKRSGSPLGFRMFLHLSNGLD